MRLVSLGREVFDIELAGLRSVRAQLDARFARAVRLAVSAVRQGHKLVVTGIGKSGLVAHKIAATLTSTGSPGYALNAVDALHGDLGIVGDGDVIFALSYSGESDEMLDLLAVLNQRNVTTVALTGELRSTLARRCDLVLSVCVPREACPFNLAPTASSTAMLVMGDALALAVSQAQHFKRQDFARLHPAGAIGHTLISRVSDIMRSGSSNAVAQEDQSLREGLLVMTRARSGCLSVTDRRGRLVGVFTDGDFRRLAARDQNPLSRPLRSIMTRRPVCICSHAAAAAALQLFEKHKIDDLIVVSAEHAPVGVVDSQDLAKLKNVCKQADLSKPYGSSKSHPRVAGLSRRRRAS